MTEAGSTKGANPLCLPPNLDELLSCPTLLPGSSSFHWHGCIWMSLKMLTIVSDLETEVKISGKTMDFKG